MYMHKVYNRAAGAEENFGDFQLYNCDSAFNLDAISIKKIQKSKIFLCRSLKIRIPPFLEISPEEGGILNREGILNRNWPDIIIRINKGHLLFTEHQKF